MGHVMLFKIIIWCIWCNRICWHTLIFKKHIIFKILYIIVGPCNAVDMYGKKEAGTGEHLNNFNNKINKLKWKAAAPHGRLPRTHNTK